MEKKKKSILLSITWILVTVLLFFSGKTAGLSAQSDTRKDQDNSSSLAESPVITADLKEEVIYAALDTDGNVKEIYAVNILNVMNTGQVSDYGLYSSVKNLTTINDIGYEGDKISAEAVSGKFYYQGNLVSRSLPWDIHITYYLDSREIPAGELAGKSGYLEVKIRTDKNIDTNPVFFENYLLQITVPLDTAKCSNISCKGGSMANSGADKLLTFTAMPSKAGEFSFHSDVIDFTMDSIEIAALPFTMGIELPDTSELTGDLVLLSEGIGQLNNGITGLADAFLGLYGGVAELDTGSSDFLSALDEVSSGAGKLELASESILSALTEVSSTLGAVSDNGTSGDGVSDEKASGDGVSRNNAFLALASLPPVLTEMSSGLAEIAAGLTDMNTGYSSSYDALSSSIGAIPDTMIPEESLQALVLDHPDDPIISRLIEVYKAAYTIKTVYATVFPALNTLGPNLSAMADSLNVISSSLDEIRVQFTAPEEGSGMMSSIQELSDGITTLSDSYAGFHEGLSGLSEGVSQLAASYAGLDNGTAEVADGMEGFHSGLIALLTGSEELTQQTADMPGQIEKTIAGLMEGYDTSDYVPVSFVSPKNGYVSSVQFVMRSAKITYEIIREDEPVEEEKDNFWTRLRDLF